MVDINLLTDSEFLELPLVVKGESKEIRYAGDGLVVIKLLPTIYSFTYNRCGVVPGSDLLRLQSCRKLVNVLKENKIKHAYREINDKWILADLILSVKSDQNPDPFIPCDLSNMDIMKLQKHAPIEVVVKRVHGGTSKHRYYKMNNSSVRNNHPLFPGFVFNGDMPYPVPVVRFDWRNPLTDDSGKMLADEALTEDMADFFIDVRNAKKTALRTYDVLQHFLNKQDILMYDICLFITEDGSTVFGEISQDCGRFRHYHEGFLDKDVWRQGGSSETVLEKWDLFNQIINRG